MNVAQSRMIEELYLEMFEKMKIYASCSLENETLAEEAVQETFRIACQKPEQLCESVNPRGWLVQTLKYTICNIQRNRSVSQRIIAKYLSMQIEDFSFSEDTIDLCVIYRNVSNTEAFKILVETAIEGKSLLEMAESRGISLSACKKRVQRAKKALRNKIYS